MRRKSRETVERENIERILVALGKVPEKHLRLIDLANEYYDGKQDLDPEKMANNQPEINLAIEEAKVYATGVENCVRSLRGLKARAVSTL